MLSVSPWRLPIKISRFTVISDLEKNETNLDSITQSAILHSTEGF